MPGSASGLRVTACIAGAGETQRGADEHREDGARHARDDRGLGHAAHVAAEPGDDLGERDLAGAEGDGQDAQHAQHESGAERARPGAPPPGAAGERHPAAACASA